MSVKGGRGVPPKSVIFFGKNFVRKGGGGTPLADKIRKVVFDPFPKIILWNAFVRRRVSICSPRSVLPSQLLRQGGRGEDRRAVFSSGSGHLVQNFSSVGDMEPTTWQSNWYQAGNSYDPPTSRVSHLNCTWFQARSRIRPRPGCGKQPSPRRNRADCANSITQHSTSGLCHFFLLQVQISHWRN